MQRTDHDCAVHGLSVLLLYAVLQHKVLPWRHLHKPDRQFHCRGHWQWAAAYAYSVLIQLQNHLPNHIRFVRDIVFFDYIVCLIQLDQSDPVGRPPDEGERGSSERTDVHITSAVF